MNTNVIIFFSAIVIYLNIVATCHVWRIDSFSTTQRLLQSLLVCLVPLLGSILMIGFHLSDKDYVNEQKIQKGMSQKLMNVFMFVSFSTASSGNIVGINELGGHDYGRSDSCDGESGGGDC